MDKTKTKATVISCLVALIAGGASVAVYFIAKKMMDDESTKVNYDLVSSQTFVVGTYKSYKDSPVSVSCFLTPYDGDRTTQESDLSSDKMEYRSGQSKDSVWSDLTEWLGGFLKEGESFADFVSKGGRFDVCSSADKGAVISSKITLTKSGVWFVGLAQGAITGQPPYVSRSSVVYKEK